MNAIAWLVAVILAGLLGIGVVVVNSKLVTGKKSIEVLQLDEGFKVTCKEVNNPYAFASRRC